jgi:hypothetical protein
MKKVLTRDRQRGEPPKRVLATPFCLIVKWGGAAVPGRRPTIGKSGEAARPGAGCEGQDRGARAVLAVEGELTMRCDRVAIGLQISPPCNWPPFTHQ